MKVFLSALEGQAGPTFTGERVLTAEMLVRDGIRMRHNLMSFYALKKRRYMECAYQIRDNTDDIMIDSGAHSFQKGKKVSWNEYVDDYAAFIKAFDRPNVIGYFEMDVDAILGMDAVLEMRRRLERVTDKIIPVWHKNRGIRDYLRMCEQYAGKVVAITGFSNEDIKDHQYIQFLKVAKMHGCRVHCLGMTRCRILDSVPFDYVDSSSWLQYLVRGHISGFPQSLTLDMDFQRRYRGELLKLTYLKAMEMQDEYERKWCNVHGTAI